MFILIIIFYLCSLTYVQNIGIFTLNNCQWKLTSNREMGFLETLLVASLARMKSDISKEVIEVEVPNGIYSILKENGIIKDIWSLNEREYSWVATREWQYYCHFDDTLDEAFLNTLNVELVFHGIDGTATIYFNGKELQTVSNSFVRYKFDITEQLMKNDNLIQIFFQAPGKTASNLSNKFKNYYDSFHEQNKYNKKNVHLLRRMQASFGTEWAPAVPSIGIWKDVELIAYQNQNDLFIRDIMVLTNNAYSLDTWEVEIKVYCEIPSVLLDAAEDTYYDRSEANSRNIGIIQADLLVENNEIIKSSERIITQIPPKETSIVISLSLYVSKNKVKLWWPNGYGSQNLYTLTVSHISDNKNENITKAINIGFRTITLNQDKTNSFNYDEEASYFYFVVNELPIFAKGANILPVSILPEESSNEKKIDYLLRSAKIAHMNMLRVPASSIYQSDYFYKKCDEYGILVWQDMMLDKEMTSFGDEEFMRSLRKEITQQFTRLQYHSSIVVWVGNNEIQDTIYNENEKINEAYTKEYKQFLKTFIDIVEQDKFRPYLTSTPFNKFINDPENIILTDDQNDFLTGDAHIHYISDTWLIINNYNVPRFASEYSNGVWSLPSFHSLHSETFNGSDLSSLSTKFMKHRQRANSGDAYETIIFSVSKHFGLPIKHHLDAFIYASQINQAWTMKSLTEHYRKWRNYISSTEGNGKTMGALFWHLNDVWQTPSASSIEYNGKWKMLHYYARKFFAPVGSSIEIDSQNKVQIHIISDLVYNIKIDLRLEIFDWFKLNPIYSGSIESVNLVQSSLLEFKHVDITELLKSFCKEANITSTCLFKLTIYDDKQVELNTNYLLPSTVSLRDIPSLPNPVIKLAITDYELKKAIITVETDAIALFVWLDAGDVEGYFSDNGFIMTKPKMKISFYMENEGDLEKLKKSINFKVVSRNFLLENFAQKNSFSLGIY